MFPSTSCTPPSFVRLSWHGALYGFHCVLDESPPTHGSKRLLQYRRPSLKQLERMKFLSVAAAAVEAPLFGGTATLQRLRTGLRLWEASAVPARPGRPPARLPHTNCAACGVALTPPTRSRRKKEAFPHPAQPSEVGERGKHRHPRTHLLTEREYWRRKKLRSMMPRSRDDRKHDQPHPHRGAKTENEHDTK